MGNCAHLEPPLNAGEQHVLEHLNRLSNEWTINVQPRLRQDVPDLVALHDTFGVCAIEVKDWSYSGSRQADNGCIEYITGDGVWHARKQQLRYQAYRYRSMISDHVFALPDDGSKPTNAVRAVVIFPNSSTERARLLLAHHQVTLKRGASRHFRWRRSSAVAQLDRVRAQLQAATCHLDDALGSPSCPLPPHAGDRALQGSRRRFDSGDNNELP